MKILFHLFIGLICPALFASNSRELIILLDSKGTNETIGNPARRYLMNKLQSALEQQEAPLLISTSLWENFLEKRMSISQMAKREVPEELKTLATYEAINKKLNESFQELQERGFDPIQSKQWMLDAVNRIFYKSPSKYSIAHELNTTLMSYLTRFDSSEWDGYLHPNHSLLLLLPKKYEAKKKKLSCNLLSRMDFLGLQLDRLLPVENLEDPAYYYLRNPREFLLADTLFYFFVPNLSLYSWNIYLSGHGGTFYEENPQLQAYTLIADLQIAEFQKFLNFCEKQILTKCLFYGTCYGSGNHSQLAFGDIPYPYAIVSDCLGDTVSYTFIDTLPLPNRAGDELTASHLSYDSKTGWSIALDFHYQWGKFFADLEAHSFTDDPLCWLEGAFKGMKPDFLSTTPVVRLPNATHFTTILSDTHLQITDLLLEWIGEEETIESTRETNVVLLEAAFIPSTLILHNDKQVPSIISILPGASSHFIQSLELKTNRGFLSAFWPLEADYFEREFLVEELSFPAQGFPLCEEWNIQKDIVILKNVWIVAKGSEIRIFLQTEEGIPFMLLTNKKDLFPQKIVGAIKGIHPLSNECTQLYLEKYQIRKEQLRENH
ncbi:MAG: hypothetical protein WA678_07580 [Rhabdochlamydiaceae bacterium]